MTPNISVLASAALDCSLTKNFAGLVDHDTLCVALTTDGGLHLEELRTETSATLAAEVGAETLPTVETTEAVEPTAVATAGVTMAGGRGASVGAIPKFTFSTKVMLIMAAVKLRGMAIRTPTLPSGWERFARGT